MRRIVLVLVVAVALAACTPPAPVPTTVRITTEQIVCGGMIPPPGEPFCLPASPVSRTVDVYQGRTLVTTVTTGTDGTAVVEVAPGDVRVAATEPPVYLDCTVAGVTAVEKAETPVTQTCILNAP